MMRAAGIEFDEVMIRFDSFAAESEFKQAITKLNPAGTVPVLADGDILLTDTMSIAEYVHETYAPIWPEVAAERAAARNLCSLMHSGFTMLRTHCPMIIDSDLKAVGQALYEMHADLRDDVALLEKVLAPYLSSEAGSGPLFKTFSAADAFFAPVMMRLNSYGLPLSPALDSYRQFMLSHEAVNAWITEAKSEEDFLEFEEPYRSAPDVSHLEAQIRAYHPDDRDAVISLWQESGLTRPWNDAKLDIADKLTVQSDLFFVMFDAGALVGSAMASFDGHRGMVYYLAINPKSQRQGFGRQLMMHVETALAAKGCRKINLMVRSENQPVQDFYDALGYTHQTVSVLGKWLKGGPDT